jgi:4-hydroxy-tetrahydrodipicolinate synthase
VPVLSLGGIGVISVLSNIMPQYTHDMIDSYLNGDVQKSRKMQLDCIPLVGALFCEVSPIPVKEALTLMDYNIGEVRLPLVPATEKCKELLQKEMKIMGIIMNIEY